MNNQNLSTVQTAIVHLPTREEIQTVRLGTEVLTVWGRWQTVSRVAYRGDDVNGKAYVGVDAQDGKECGSTISASMKEATLCRTLPLTKILNSAECDEIETLCGELGITDALLVEIAA